MKDKASFYARWIVMIAVSIVVVVIANALARQLDRRLDLTDQKIYTVSDETRTILTGIEDIVTIQYYVSEKLPGYYANLPRDTKDFLEEYERLAEGKIRVEIIDPDKLVADYVKEKAEEGGDDEPVQSFNPFAPGPQTPRQEKEQELAQMGVQKLQGQIVEDDRFEMLNFYSSIVIKYLDKPSVPIERHTQLDGLEYELASRILKLTATQKPKIAFFLGRPDNVRMVPSQFPQMPPQKVHPYQLILNQVFAETFDITEIELTETSLVPDEAKLLIVAEPHELSQRQIYEIDRYIASGRPAMFWVSRNTSNVNDPSWPITGLFPGLDPVFDAWGIKLDSQMVFSVDCAPVAIEQSLAGIPVRSLNPWPPCPVATAKELSRESPLTAGLPAVVFPFASRLTHDDTKLAENGLELTVLARSTERSWLPPWGPQLQNEMINPPKTESGEFVFQGSFDLAYLLEGQFPSSFEAGKPLPAWSTPVKENADGEEGASEEETAPEPSELIPPLTTTGPTQVIVCASADMAKEDYFRQSRDYLTNIGFFQNAIESIALGHDLLRIRSKGQTTRPFEKELTPKEKDVMFYGNAFGIPFAVIVLGVLRYLWRRGAARRYEERFLRTRQSGGE